MKQELKALLPKKSMINHKWILAFGILVSVFIQAEDKILLCIHGFMRSKSNMSLIRTSFEKKGWLVYVWSYPSRLKTIEEHGEDLLHVIEFLSKKHPAQPLCFVTHSMGGLILRKAVSHEQCPEEAKIGKAVLIAPPNQGSAYARFLNQFRFVQEVMGSYAGRQLLTTEKGGFENLGQFPSSMKILVIAGICGFNPVFNERNDGKVSVGETRLSTPHEFKTVLAGHSWICHTPRTVELAKEFLEEDHES
jgi:triacylglycerol esterase/lipase EstA (alpha/beta hydrolase family)